jgi:hypothetical protein
MFLKIEQTNYASNVQSDYEQVGWVVEECAAAENDQKFYATEEREQETVEWHQVVRTREFQWVDWRVGSEWLKKVQVLMTGYQAGVCLL